MKVYSIEIPIFHLLEGAPITTQNDRDHLRTAIELATQARQNGNEPFGALLVNAEGHVLMEAMNTVSSDRDPTAHVETNLLRRVCPQSDNETLQSSTLYASCEPCPMCAGAIYWSGVGRVVFALPAEALLELKSEPPDHLSIPCREVLKSGHRPVQAVGPMHEQEARRPFEGFREPSGPG